MNRKDFIKYGSLTSAALLASSAGFSHFNSPAPELAVKPLAIAMWDFSWLERRWTVSS